MAVRHTTVRAALEDEEGIHIRLTEVAMHGCPAHAAEDVRLRSIRRWLHVCRILEHQREFPCAAVAGRNLLDPPAHVRIVESLSVVPEQGSVLSALGGPWPAILRAVTKWAYFASQSRTVEEEISRL